MPNKTEKLDQLINYEETDFPKQIWEEEEV